ncbi:MAG: serine/threonine-protein kinase [Candidatus Woesearchaeota archaeon]|nr:serine/threonine-protein kinase [Candidatus Woesearchaeota archaeon]
MGSDDTLPIGTILDTRVLDRRRTSRVPNTEKLDQRVLEEARKNAHTPQRRPSELRAGEEWSLRPKRYKILEKLGEGGMGETYLAEKSDDAGIEGENGEPTMPAVLKLATEVTQEAVLASVRELEALVRVNSPHVVDVHDFGIISDGKKLRFYIDMEVAKGKPIDEACAGLSYKRLSRIANKTLDGTGAINRAGLLHVDLKPDNIFVHGGDVKILDLGLASSIEAAPDPQFLKGTLAYMSPEQLMNKPLTPASDIYQWGMVWYKILTGEDLRDGMSLTDIVQSIHNEDTYTVAYGRAIQNMREKADKLRPLSMFQWRERRMRDMLIEKVQQALTYDRGIRPQAADRLSESITKRAKNIHNVGVGLRYGAAGVGTLAVLVGVIGLYLRNTNLRADARELLAEGQSYLEVHDTQGAVVACREGLRRMDAVVVPTLSFASGENFSVLEARVRTCLAEGLVGLNLYGDAKEVLAHTPRTYTPQDNVLRHRAEREFERAIDILEPEWQAGNHWAGNFLTEAYIQAYLTADGRAERTRIRETALEHAACVVQYYRSLETGIFEGECPVQPENVPVLADGTPIVIPEGTNERFRRGLINELAWIRRHAGLLRGEEQEARYDDARAKIKQAFESARQNNDNAGRAFILRRSGVLEHSAENFAEAERNFNDAIAIYDALAAESDHPLLFRGLRGLALERRGVTKNNRRNFIGSAADLAEAVRTYDELGNRRALISDAAYNFALPLLSLGRLDEALENIELYIDEAKGMNLSYTAGLYSTVQLIEQWYRGTELNEQLYEDAMENFGDYRGFETPYAELVWARTLANAGEGARARTILKEVLRGVAEEKYVDDEYNMAYLLATQAAVAYNERDDGNKQNDPSATRKNRKEMSDLLDSLKDIEGNIQQFGDLHALVYTEIMKLEAVVDPSNAAASLKLAKQYADESKDLYSILNVRLEAAGVLLANPEVCAACPSASTLLEEVEGLQRGESVVPGIRFLDESSRGDGFVPGYRANQFGRFKKMLEELRQQDVVARIGGKEHTYIAA